MRCMPATAHLPDLGLIRFAVRGLVSVLVQHLSGVLGGIGFCVLIPVFAGGLASCSALLLAFPDKVFVEEPLFLPSTRIFHVVPADAPDRQGHPPPFS
jgi:hypothetical protein